MENNQSFAREFGHSIFNFGAGFFLITLAALPNWAAWGISIFVAIMGFAAIVKFGALAHFWGLALKHTDRFSPSGDLNDRGKAMFGHTVNACYDYRNKETYWFSVAASLVFMAALIQHQLWIAFVFEAIASVIGYAVIRSFLTHFHIYYKLVEGKELENV
jgi:hypothetical protein